MLGPRRILNYYVDSGLYIMDNWLGAGTAPNKDIPDDCPYMDEPFFYSDRMWV